MLVQVPKKSEFPQKMRICHFVLIGSSCIARVAAEILLKQSAMTLHTGLTIEFNFFLFYFFEKTFAKSF